MNPLSLLVASEQWVDHLEKNATVDMGRNSRPMSVEKNAVRVNQRRWLIGIDERVYLWRPYPVLSFRVASGCFQEECVSVMLVVQAECR